MNGRQYVWTMVAQGLLGMTALLGATVLAALGHLDAQSVVAIYGTAIGAVGASAGATAAAAFSRPLPPAPGGTRTTTVTTPPEAIDGT